MRGAATSAYGVDPDIGIAIDVTPAGDTPNTLKMEMTLGKGPCIKIQDAGMISDARVVQWMIRTAEKNKIPHQREVLLALADGLGIAAQEGGDIIGAPMTEFGGLDGRIPPAVLLRERVVGHPHRMLDLGAVRHGGASVARS